jgi:hypothetical protein
LLEVEEPQFEQAHPMSNDNDISFAGSTNLFPTTSSPSSTTEMLDIA